MQNNNYNELNSEETSEKKIPFYKNSMFWGSVAIFAFMILPLSLMTIKSSHQNQQLNKQNNKIVERKISAHKFSELKIKPELSIIQPNEKFRFIISRDIFFTGNMSNVHLLVKLPDNVPNRQNVYNVKVSPNPRRILEKSDGKYAEILLPNPHGTINVSIKGEASVKTYNLATAEKQNKNLDEQLTEEARLKYLKEDNGIETKSRFVQNIVNNQIETATNETDTVKNVFDYIVNRLRYDRSDINKDKGALAALHSGSGVCEEFTKAFITLCRAKNIPARMVTGFDIPLQDNIKDKYTGHTWAEVYFPKYGWVTFDPTNTLSEEIRKKAEKLNISPYDLLYGIIENKLYLIIDARMVTAKYDGSGGMSSKNLAIQYIK